MRGSENISKYYVLEGLAVFFFPPTSSSHSSKKCFPCLFWFMFTNVVIAGLKLGKAQPVDL